MKPLIQNFFLSLLLQTYHFQWQKSEMQNIKKLLSNYNLKTNEESVFIADEDDEIIGLFVFVGLKSQTDLFKGLLNLDEKGYIKTDENMKTNIDGVYAIGDCRSKDLRQVITACNDGAIAAINVEKYIN